MNRCTLQQCLLQLQFVFFRHAACAHQTPQREFAKAAVCLYQMFYPQRRCRRQSVYCTYLFFLHVFQTRFKRKKTFTTTSFTTKRHFSLKKICFLLNFVFPARFFTPSLSVKNIYHHKFYNKKTFFTQKNLFFTQFCYVLFI